MNPKLALLLSMLRGQTPRDEDEYGRPNRLGRSAPAGGGGLEAPEERSAAPPARGGATAAVAAKLPVDDDGLLEKAFELEERRRAMRKGDAAEAAVALGGPGTGVRIRQAAYEAARRPDSAALPDAEAAWKQAVRPGGRTLSPAQAEALAKARGKTADEIIEEAERLRARKIEERRRRNMGDAAARSARMGGGLA